MPLSFKTLPQVLSWILNLCFPNLDDESLSQINISPNQKQREAN